MNTTYYFVQVLDDGFPKNVPHTGKKNCEFLDKNKAVDFKNNLKLNNPNEKFRLVKRTEKYISEKWE